MNIEFTTSPVPISASNLLQETLTEEHFTLDGVQGALWRPVGTDGPTPLVILGHPGGLERMLPRLRARAEASAALGLSSATIELPGAGGWAPLEHVDRARVELRASLREGREVSADTVDRLILPLVAQAAPEWQGLIDELLSLPGMAPMVAVSGGIAAIAVHLLAADTRISAAVIFAGSYVPDETLRVAGSVTVPVHMLLQWDDHGNDRQMALDLFDALGSMEKTLEANMGGHTGVPAHAGEGASRFFARHLGPKPQSTQ